MARIILHYSPGNSPLHRWDARCKFFGLFMITATLLQSKIAWLTFDSILLLGLLFLSGLPIRQFVRDFWVWTVFLFVLFLFQAFFTPGRELSFFPWVPVTQDGLRLGGFTCWRLALILCYAVLFTAVTRPRELQDTVIWLLKPFPFLHGRRVGLMVSLSIRFFSIILDQAEEVRLAHKARLGDLKKNPFRKIKFLALPLLRRSFLHAEDVTLALAARGFRDDLPLRLPKLPYSQLTPLLCIPGFLAVIWWFHL
ncbi:MAG TPA: energy-coupling factor transporter transmembrane component T [Thermodesulfobacteriota bacterium]|nr:energy-coupling factor transporter transmembrane component T [Thermodesulfobacteriota bacterium]